MNAPQNIKNLLSRLVAWKYLIFLGTSALLVTLKGFALGQLLDQTGYASYSYFQLFSGLGGILAGAGIILRYHVEMPALLNKGDNLKTIDFTNKASTILIFNSIFFTISLLGFVYFKDGDIIIAALGACQAILMLFFTIELIKIKSNGNFNTYGIKLLYRNLAIFSISLLSASVTRSATLTAFAEVGINIILSGSLILRNFNHAVRPDWLFIKKTLHYSPLEAFGSLAQYQERIAASFILSKMEFSRFSYFFILINIGLTLQQFINTKLIVSFSTENSKKALRTFKIGSIGLFFSVSMLTVFCLAIVYTLNAHPDWLSPDFDLLILIIIISALKGADITQSYLTCLHRKKVALALQITGCVTLATVIACMVFFGKSTLLFFLQTIAAWQSFYLLISLLSIFNIHRAR